MVLLAINAAAAHQVQSSKAGDQKFFISQLEVVRYKD